MSREFSQNIVGNGKIIDFHTHPYRHRGEFMGMYGEHFYLEPEQMPADLAEAGISVFCGSVIDSDHRGAMESFDRVREVNCSSGRSSAALMCPASTCTSLF